MADTPPGAVPAPPPDQPAAPLPPGPPTVPAPPLKSAGWRRALALAATILFIAGCAVYILFFELAPSLGVEALTIGIIAAILPVPVLVACFLWLDRYKPEPKKYLLMGLCFGWGAFASTSASLNVNRTSAKAFDAWGLPDALVAVLVAPFIEELTKALGPILLLVLLLLRGRRRGFSGIVDGIVYCGMAAVGFAMVENIIYLGGHGYAQGTEQYGRATGLTNVLAIFILRILLSGFAHPMFTAMAGIGLGIAARTADRRVRVFAPLIGLLVAMMLHGAWNFTPSIAEVTGQSLIVLYGYIAVMVPIFLGMVGLAIWLRGWEGRITERRLPDYVRAGWLTPPEVAALGSLGRRHAARRWARRVAGDAGLRAMRAFQFSAMQLALLRDGMLRGLHDKPDDRARVAREERQLLDALSAYRQVFVGRDPQAPRAVWGGNRYHVTFPDGVQRSLDAPNEPVVPIPVVLAPPPPPVPAGPPGAYGFGPYPGAHGYPHHPAPPPGAGYPGTGPYGPRF
ncbi:MAG TPA: PrsW family intramembrane metalloprotease [Micromonosporaceae bacterium]|nr:PrsW family intramembrane metalloprotease [Micromonosporaceae bacterium]